MSTVSSVKITQRVTLRSQPLCKLTRRSETTTRGSTRDRSPDAGMALAQPRLVQVRLSVYSIIALGLAACGNTDSKSTAPDAAVSGPDAATPATALGTVEFSVEEIARVSQVDAVFYPQQPSCTNEVIGKCQIRTCPTLPTPVSAGKLQLSWTDFQGPQMQSLVAGPQGNYFMHVTGAALWKPNTNVTISGPGDTVPAFSVAATMPPGFQMGFEDGIYQAQPFRVAVTALGATDWEILISQATTRITCTYDATMRDVQVPVTVLAKLVKDKFAHIAVRAVRTTTVRAGAYAIVVRTVQEGVEPWDRVVQ